MELKEIFMGAIAVCAVVMVSTGAGLKELGLEQNLMGGGGGGPYNLGYNLNKQADGKLLNWDLSHGKLRPPGIATVDGYALISEVAADHPGNAGQVPQSIVALANDDCTVRPPQEGEVIANVYAASGYFQSGIGVATRAELETRAEKWIESYYKDMLRSPRLLGYERHQTMDVVDVYVTDTSAPVYLILQARGGSSIFNLQVADGVEIAQVAVVSTQTVGVSNVPEATPIDLIGPGCGYAMWRMPKAQWDFVENTRNGIGDEELLDSHYQNAGVYSDWFAGVFGIGAEQGQAGFGHQSYVLAGPMPAPEALIPYTPMGVVHLTENERVLTGTFDERKAGYRWAVEEVMFEATGTDLASFLANAPMTRDATAVVVPAQAGDQ